MAAGACASSQRLRALNRCLHHVVWSQATSEGREELLRSLAQVGAQFLIVGLVGFFLKEYLDARREEQRRVDAEVGAERRRQDALDAFRLDVLRRVVGTANRVRRTAVVLDAERSAKAYAEQMRSLADWNSGWSRMRWPTQRRTLIRYSPTGLRSDFICLGCVIICMNACVNSDTRMLDCNS